MNPISKLKKLHFLKRQPFWERFLKCKVWGRDQTKSLIFFVSRTINCAETKKNCLSLFPGKACHTQLSDFDLFKAARVR